MIILDPAADKVDDGKAAVAEPIAVSSVSRSRPGITRISPSEQPSPNEPPPVYTPSSAVSNTSTAMAYPQRIPDTFSKLNPSNFVSIDRKNGSMTGSWLIDPHLVIPVPLRPPLGQDETEQTRRNLNLKTSNGYMDLDISLAPFDPNAKDQKLLPKRLTLAVKSSNGSIKVKLVSQLSYSLPHYRRPLSTSMPHMLPFACRSTFKHSPQMGPSPSTSLDPSRVF